MNLPKMELTLPRLCHHTHAYCMQFKLKIPPHKVGGVGFVLLSFTSHTHTYWKCSILGIQEYPITLGLKDDTLVHNKKHHFTNYFANYPYASSIQPCNSKKICLSLTKIDGILMFQGILEDNHVANTHNLHKGF